MLHELIDLKEIESQISYFNRAYPEIYRESVLS